MEERADPSIESTLEHTSSATPGISPIDGHSTILQGYQSQSNKLPESSGLFPSRNASESSGKFSAAGLANWAKGLRISRTSQENSNSRELGKNPFNLISNGFGKRSATKIPVVDAPYESPVESPRSQEGAFGTFAKGMLDTSKHAVKAVQTRARHLVSQNKRRYQEDGFDLDLTYITDNIIAMGFPAGDTSSGLLGFVEGFYRNHMEEVIKFFETHHKEKYKVYNLCSERLYDPSLFEGKVACFPFDDHNCPPLQLVAAFCQSAYSWLKADLENVVVVHCKAGKARTGLMISSLLLYLKFFPTADESMVYYNKKRCVDGKGLILPSQMRYVKYFEHVLRNCTGQTPMGRKVVLRGFRLHKCPHWIRPSITISDHNGIVFSSKKHPRTKGMMPEDIWSNVPRQGMVVFTLPGERGLADLDGDFKVLFRDRHGDFYCWVNTNMMENRTLLSPADLDGFEKRKLPSPGFQVEIVIVNHDTSLLSATGRESLPHSLPSVERDTTPVSSGLSADTSQSGGVGEPGGDEKGSVFSDSENDGSMGKHVPRRSGEKIVSGHASEEDTGSPKEAEGWQLEGSVVQGSTERSRLTQTSAINASSHKTLGGGRGMNAEDYSNSAQDNQDTMERKHDTLFQRSTTESDEPSSVDEKVKPDVSDPLSDFKVIAAASAADASVFTFGDEEDYESEEE